jgi:hypothetical protein
MNAKAIEKSELNKILSLTANYAVLEGSKMRLLETQPSSELNEVKKRLKLTEESIKLLFMHGMPGGMEKLRGRVVIAHLLRVQCRMSMNLSVLLPATARLDWKRWL